MDFEHISQGFEDAPERDFPLKPEVWCLGLIESAEERKNSYVNPPVDEINLKLRISESSKAEDGSVAKGVEFAALCAPPRGHEAFSGKRRGYMLRLFTAGLTAALAPGVKDEAAARTQAQDALKAGGVQALIGKELLFKIGVNDGRDRKTGEVKNEKRAEKPRNEVTNFMAATNENIQKYVRGAGAAPAKQW